MRTELKKVLKTLQPWERVHLNKALELAFWIEALKTKYGVRDERLQRELTLTRNELKAALNGTFNYDLMFIAKLQQLEVELIREKKMSETGAVIVGNLQT